jgi:hypothetical protein
MAPGATATTRHGQSAERDNDGAMSNQLAAVQTVIDTLTEASLLLVHAARWADRDRFSFSPIAVFAPPLKYWYWHRAKKRVELAAQQLDALRAPIGESLADVGFSKLDAVNDLFDMFPFSITRVGTKGGPSPIKQQFGVETTVLHQIETSRTTVDHVLSEVGLLHAKLRATSAVPPGDAFV